MIKLWERMVFLLSSSQCRTRRLSSLDVEVPQRGAPGACWEKRTPTIAISTLCSNSAAMDFWFLIFIVWVNYALVPRNSLNPTDFGLSDLQSQTDEPQAYRVLRPRQPLGYRSSVPVLDSKTQVTFWPAHCPSSLPASRAWLWTCICVTYTMGCTGVEVTSFKDWRAKLNIGMYMLSRHSADSGGGLGD